MVQRRFVVRHALWLTQLIALIHKNREHLGMSAEDRVLITGAAGFVGSAVARAAQQRGYQLRVLIRPGSPRRNLAGLDAELIEGDIRDQACVGRALEGVRYLFHVAADYRLWARNPGEIERNNLEGTGAVMRAALSRQVERVVYTSSVATLRVDSQTIAATEDEPLPAHEAIGAYKRSKVLAERMVEQMVVRDRLQAVIVNPSTPIGIQDVRPTPTGRLLVEAATGKMPAFVDTGLNLVNVEDVALGHLLALERGQIGERYILGGDNITLQHLLGEIAVMTGRRAPTIKLPLWPLYPLARAAEAVAQLTGKEPFMTVDGLKMSKNRMFFSSAKAERELGYRPGPHLPALRAALDWFGRTGYLK
ncbi:MAG: NAD-dependent epimerase/dehydratase [Herminiimonas sp.]|nr:NAD-dependent epimerase/dehydratase [Herminiimonas sp.]